MSAPRTALLSITFLVSLPFIACNERHAPTTPPVSVRSTTGSAASHPATPSSAPGARPKSATRISPRDQTWARSPTVAGVSLAVIPEHQGEAPGPPPGDVRRGAQTATLEQVFGKEWAPMETWTAEAQARVFNGHRYVQLTLTGVMGEDLRQIRQWVALLDAEADHLRPLWRGPGQRETIEMDQCDRGTGFKLSSQGASLIITREGFAEYQAPVEEENSQTPSFDALKATCTAPKSTVERITLPQSP